MRIQSSVTAISWIPSDAIEGLPKLPFELGIGHYDQAPPDRLEPGDLERLRDEDRFHEANQLAAWIEVEDGRITGFGHEGGGLVGSTTFRAGPKSIRVPGVRRSVCRGGWPGGRGDRSGGDPGQGRGAQRWHPSGHVAGADTLPAGRDLH